MYNSLDFANTSEMESFSNSSDEEIPIATVSKESCPKAVVAEAHSTRDEDVKRSQNAQVHKDWNSKSKRPCDYPSKKAVCAARGEKMDGEAKTISVRLRNPELWDMFHRQDTEMIITKAGRYVDIFSCVLLEEL